MNCSVLVVDDEYEIRQLLTTMLTLMGYQSFMAQDGLDALEKIPEYQPDILILDVMMPNMDGLTLCRKLRAAAETAELPIIMLSGKAHQEAIQEGLKAGANRYLVKPTGLDELTRNITEVLGEAAVSKRVEA
ncbi:MAG: response regulator [Ardenticatenaceae bacterium]|nr:response regulator [Anaerolineales bacterium]MCB8941804.1 response regulator [Ardenticatenaceae bacterium]MCB8972916.1 response regulator [Ardenticatenaceae bacterium]